MSDAWQGKEVVVTGGTGFLGYHLVQQLSRLGAKVRVLSLQPRANHPLLKQTEIVCHFGDLLDADFTASALRNATVIFHTAGFVSTGGPSLAKMHTVHVEGTRNVMEKMEPGSRVVHTSSVVSVGAGRGEILTEESPFNLRKSKMQYVHAKRNAEELALSYVDKGKDIVITNPGYLIGPEDYERSVMGKFCYRFWKGKMPTIASGGLSLVDVRDVAAGHIQAAEHGKAGQRYILAGENLTTRGFCTLLMKVSGLNPRWLPTSPAWLLKSIAGFNEMITPRNHEPQPSLDQVRVSDHFWYYSSKRAETELGYRFRPVLDSLTDAYLWHTKRRPVSWNRFRKWWWRPSGSPSMRTEPTV